MMTQEYSSVQKLIGTVKELYTASASKAAEVAEHFRDEFNGAVDQTKSNPGKPEYDIAWYVGSANDSAKTARYLDVFCREFHERFQQENTPLVVKPILDKAKEGVKIGIRIKNPHNHISYAEFVWPLNEIDTLSDLHTHMTDVGEEEVLDQFENNKDLKQKNLENIVMSLKQCQSAGMLEETNSGALIQDVVLMEVLARELGYKDAADNLASTLDRMEKGEISVHAAVLEALLVSHELEETKEQAKEVTKEQAQNELLKAANKKKGMDI